MHSEDVEILPERKSVDPMESPATGQVELPCRIMMVGRTGSGKTHTLVSGLLTDPNFLMGRFRVIHVFSKTLEMDPEWETVYRDPEAFFVYRDYDDAMVGRILQEQKDIKEKHPENLEDVLIIVDDQGFGTSSRKPSVIRNFDEVAYMGRHFRISVIALAQRKSMASITFRDQKSHAFAWNNCSADMIKTLLDEIGGTMDRQILKQLFRYCTAGEYNFMYVKQVKGGVWQIWKNLEEEELVSNVNAVGPEEEEILNEWLASRGFGKPDRRNRTAKKRKPESSDAE